MPLPLRNIPAQELAVRIFVSGKKTLRYLVAWNGPKEKRLSYLASVCDFPPGFAVEGLKALPLTSDGFAEAKGCRCLSMVQS